MADAPDVKVKITAEDGGVAAAIKQLIAQLQTLKSKEKEVADSTKGLKEAFQGFIEILAVEKLAEFGNEVFQSGVKIARLSQVTGISTETISVYAQAVKDAGGEVGDMQASLGKLSTVITQSEQGNQKAAKSLALVGLSTKDFIGLNSDQKIRKVTDALGALPPGFQKTAAASKLLGDATGATINAMTNLAGDGFDHAREEAEKFGNLLTTDTARDLLITQAALKDLEAAAEGAARQFEAGIVPALTDVANAILAATTGEGVSGFRKMGQVAGDVFREIATIAIGFVDTIGRAFAKGSADIQNLGRAAADTFTKGFAEANRLLSANTQADYKRIDDFFQSREDAAIAELQGLHREQDEAKARIDDANAKRAKNPPIQNDEATKGALKAQQQADELFRLTIEGKNKQLLADVEIEKAFANQREAVAQSEFERGLLSLRDYYAARKVEIEQGNREELAALQAEKSNEQKLADRFQSEARGNRAKATKAGVDTPVGQEFSAAAAKDQQSVIKAKEAIAALDTKIQVTEEAGKTKLVQQDLARYKAEQDQLQKLTAFRKTILDIQGKTAEAAKIEADAKEAEFRLLLTSQLGAGNPEIEVQIQQYKDLTAAAATFTDQRKAGEDALKSLADDRAAIELRVQSGQIFQIQADEQLRDLDASRLANLNKIADAQLASAKATGNEANIQQALDFKRSVSQIELEANDAAKDLAKIKGGFQQGLQGSFESFFDTGIIGARTLGQAFAGLADSITGSLRKIVGGMLAQIATQKLLKAIPGLSANDNPATKIASSAAAGTAQAAPLTAAATALAAAGTEIVAGGTSLVTGAATLTATGATLLAGATAIEVAAAQLQVAADTMLIANASGGGGGGGAAEGGLILGPGTGTSDSIPARLSTGEFVMRAAAVRAIGVATLSSMNRGFNVGKMIHAAPVAQFAHGGLVGGTGGASSSHSVHLQVGLDEGIVLKHLKSDAAGKVVVSHLANNPKGAAKAIGRSQ
jgi:hypothetical protein